ncbi:hypothetical protein INT45_001136 [Circinella minor]|uniref:C3H1-type domain-containing protein n=1 Tax=Circinella minor TaxID=1195481 RepID=A0A8H7VM90_9FUNG|nr:hypothetical protein INT45_001136 [Circinella minor]
MSTNAELLQRIAQLSGAIQQHQNSQSSNNNNNSNNHRGRGSLIQRGRQWTSRGRGGPVNRTLNNTAVPFSHNKKLVLNQSSPSTAFSATNSHNKKLVLNQPPSTTLITNATSTTPTSHNKKLILNQSSTSMSNNNINKNTSYPTFTPSSSYTQPRSTTGSSRSTPPISEPKRVLINDVSFLVKGKKLIREDKLNVRPAAKAATVIAASAKLPATGSHVLVSRRLIHGRRDRNGNMSIGQVPRKVIKKVKPQRSKRGNMVLVREPEGYIRQGRSGKSLVLKTKRLIRRSNCGMFTRYGVCPKGPRCTFLHDRNHRAICPKFIQNRCRKSETDCRLSHTPTPNIMPHCVHFQRGKCNNTDCIFMHVRVRPDAPVCRSFAMEGYCTKGLECREKHIHVCPEFAETGKCSNANCRLPHVARRTAAEAETKESITAGIVRPGSWVSTAYFNAQKQAKRKMVEEKKQQKKGNMEWKHPTLQQQEQLQQEKVQLSEQQQHQPIKKTREEEEEEGFVRLFDDIDDDENGWAQYTSRQDDSHEELRFNEEESEDEEVEEEEDEEDFSDDSDDSGSDSEEDYEEFEIADEDGDTIMEK